VTRFVPHGERVLISIKPHPLFIVLVPLGAVAVAIGLGAVAAWSSVLLGLPIRPGAIWLWLSVLVGLRLLWQAFEWLARAYVLTDRRVLRLGGVLRRYKADLPLERLQHVSVFQSIRERIFGLGTIGFATAGTGASEAFWIMVARPDELVQQVRDAVSGVTDRPDDPGLPTIGLAGASGAGKSTVARILADLGCEVSDSDRLAKEALEREDVKRTLVSWWGEKILRDDGSVDRGVLADIVFEDPEARRRLEGLTHPVVGEMRREAFAKAGGSRAFVIDAPLLFEAGVDDECDVVIFVDAPEEERLRRLESTRGWSREEVARRERAQLALQTKRERSDHVMSNDVEESALRTRVEALLERIEREWTSRRGTRGDRRGRDGL